MSFIAPFFLAPGSGLQASCGSHMLNYIWAGLILAAILAGSISQTLPAVTEGAFKSAQTAVMDLALPLVGAMAMWLGFMRLSERAGLIQALARAMRPVLGWLFPEIPADHPALGSMMMNFAANMLGLSNAATPLGLRAMKDLDRLNPHPGTATNAMCTFLAINTSSIQLIPASTMALMAAAGSKNPSAIVGTALMATACSTVVGVASVKLLQSLPFFAPPPAGSTDNVAAAAAASSAEAPLAGPPEVMPPKSAWPGVVAWLVLALFAVLFTRSMMQGDPSAGVFTRAITTLSVLAVPFCFASLILYALARGVRVYEDFVEGAKEGFETAVRVIPYMVAMLVAIGMFRAAGCIDWLSQWMRPVLDAVHFPTEILPLALMRPLSGSGSNAIFVDLMKTHGPDSLIARMGGTLIGSTETTFYVLAVYFGSVGVRRARHALVAGLLADLMGIVAAVAVCRWVFT